MPRPVGDRQAIFVYLDKSERKQLDELLEEISSRTNLRRVTLAEYVRAVLKVARKHRREVLEVLGVA